MSFNLVEVVDEDESSEGFFLVGEGVSELLDPLFKGCLWGG